MKTFDFLEWLFTIPKISGSLFCDTPEQIEHYRELFKSKFPRATCSRRFSCGLGMDYCFHLNHENNFRILTYSKETVLGFRSDFIFLDSDIASNEKEVADAFLPLISMSISGVRVFPPFVYDLREERFLHILEPLSCAQQLEIRNSLTVEM